MFAAKRAARSAFQYSSRRTFAGHGHEAKHYEGVEAVVRKYLPEDHHIVLGTLGLYAAGFLLFKLTRGKPKPVAEEQVVSTKGAKDDIPSVLSEKFDKWSQQPGNMAKWEKSLVKWEKDMNDSKYAAAWEKAAV